MLVAHVINQKPELFRAAILKSPFLDVVNTLEDKTPQFLSSEYQEFGNPFDSDEYYKTVYSYSPYENIKRIEYPAVYIDVSLQDFRVPSWGTLKYVEKLRDLSRVPQRIPDFKSKNIVVNISAEQAKL